MYGLNFQIFQNGHYSTNGETFKEWLDNSSFSSPDLAPCPVTDPLVRMSFKPIYNKIGLGLAGGTVL